MAKFKAAGSRKPSARSNLAVVPCAVVILAGIAILVFLFYELLKQGS